VRVAAAYFLVLAIIASYDLVRAESALPPAASQQVEFQQQIQPLFEKHCVKCHGPEKQKGDLRLDVKSMALRGGADGAVIVPGKGSESRLVVAVSGVDEDLIMPPKGERLSAQEVGVLRRWIDDGAVWPDNAGGADPALTHWSFRDLQRPKVPGTEYSNAIDAFISTKLAEKQLTLSPPADARTLIRRMYFDVLGLPPTPEEADAFEVEFAKDSKSALSALADRLLASPHYGERWARHWLDVVRFAESDGFETNQPRANAWPYRDYVIRAFNSDKPYDQFVREQIAGDACGADEATGFLVAGARDQVKSPDPVLTAQQRADELHDIVSTTGSAFLGLTVGCARCHNHKFDPILQTDYYAMKAVLAGVQHGERRVGETDAASKAEADKLRPRLAEIDRELEQCEPFADTTPTGEKKRAAVNSKRNSERIVPTHATHLRFAITKTNNGSEPCIDELEVFDSGGTNVALGARTTSSGNYANDPKHQLAHLNDSKYGNSWSWISNTAGRGWVELEFAGTVEVARIVWGRDREERFRDRTAAEYVIEVREGEGGWRSVAGSNDRGATPVEVPAAIGRLEAERSELEMRIAALTAPRTALRGCLRKAR
jgi:mono/diheme cytochrome c family protein